MMIENVPKDAKAIYIPHIFNEQEAEEVKEILEERYPNAYIELTVLGPVIGAHLGPKAMGVCFLW